MLADSRYNLWAEVTEGVARSFAQCLDAAIFAGTVKPASWPRTICPAAEAAGNTNVADSTPADGGIINDLGETMDDVEDDRLEVTGFAAARPLKGLLRKAARQAKAAPAEAPVTGLRFGTPGEQPETVTATGATRARTRARSDFIGTRPKD